MLAVAPLRDTTNDENHGCVSESAVNSFSFNPEEFPDFADGNLLESIDFDDLFVGINDGDVLPDLEMDPEILADFSASGGEESASEKTDEENNSQRPSGKEEGDKLSGSGSGAGSGKGDEIVNSKREGSKKAVPGKENEKGRKSSSAQAAKSSNSSSNQGKRKVKVDWTPELHRRFVQAVEQLGVDKAVPSRILELMGIDCLTRHNIASHLQKYRSHRKHLLAREAEAASWTQRRQMYGSAVAGGGGGKKLEMSPWVAPTMGFPPITPMHPHFRPLHVWGHPSIDQALHHIWPKHLAHSPPPPPAWLPPPPPSHPSFWHHQHHRAVPNGPTPGTPCFPQAIPATRFGAAAVAGIPSHQSHGVAVPTGHSVSGPHRPPFDFQPSKESIDAAIEDVLSKPWLPLPLGLKPPTTDSVMVELQRQGVPKVPPNPTSSSSSCATAAAALN